MERIDGLSIGLNLDSTALERGIPGLKSKLTALNSEMKANMSAFDRSDQSIAKYETRLQGLNKKIELQKRIVSESKAEYEKMVREHGKGSVEADRAAKAYNNQVASLNNLERYTKGQREELNKLVKEQRKSESSWGKMGEAMKTAGGHMKTMGDGIKGLGSSMTALGTTTVVGLGTAMGLAAASYEDSTVRMKNSLGLTTGEAKNLTEASRNIYKKGFSESTQEIDSALIQTRQNIRDLNDSDLERITNKALVLADTFEADVNEVTRAGNNVMKGFGIEADEAFDLMAAGAQRGLNFSNEMFDNLSEYAPLFGKMGYSAEEYFELLVNGAEAGVYNLDYINDVMKENQLRLKDGSKTTSDAMGKLSKSTQNVWKEFLKGDKTVKDVSNAVLGELEGMDDQVAANQIGVDLYGTKWEDLEADAMYSLGGIDGGLKDVDGTLNEMINNTEQSMSQQWKSTWRDAKDALLPLGQTLLEFARDIMPDVKEGITGVTDWLNNMDDSTKKNIVKFAGFVAAAGPVLMTLGSLVSSVAGVVTIAGSLSGMIAGAGGLGATLATFATGPVGITIGALAALTAGGVALYNYFKEDAIPVLSDFGDSVSDTTTDAVLAYKNLNDEATIQLNELLWSQQEITPQIAEQMISTFSEMGKQVKENLQTDFDESYQILSTFLSNSKTLSETEQQAILDNMRTKQTERQVSVDEHMARIQEIWDTASNEKRAVTKAEQQEINRIQDEMTRMNVEAVSKSESEQITILSRLKQESGNITTRQAAETVKNSLDAKNGSVKEANDKYNKVKNALEYERDVTGSISEDQANTLISDAERQRKETVKKAEEMHDGVVEQAQKQAEGQISKVDWGTGEVLTQWNLFVRDTARAVNSLSDGINSVLGWVGVDWKIPKWEPKGYTDAPTGYEKGTPSTGHPGGPAIVGEKGPELAHLPGLGVRLLGTKGAELHPNLPKGTSVLPNRHTENLLKSYGFPGYENGVGDYFKWVIEGPKKLLNKVWDKFNVGDPSWSVGGFLDDLGDSSIDFLKEKSFEFLKGKISDFTSFDSNAPGNVKGWISAAIARTGVPTSWLGPLTTIAMKESGGRTGPSTINKWDINWLRGIPSMGLMQTIGPTFNAFKEKGWGDIMNPTHNAAAAINYIKSRYGTVYNVPGIKALAQGRPYVGYATGARVAHKGLYQLAEEGHPEYVISTDPKRRTDSMKLLALAGKEIAGNKRPNQLFSPAPGSEGFDMDKFARMVAQLLAEYGLKEYKPQTTIIASQPMNAVEAARAAERQSQKQARDWGFST